MNRLTERSEDGQVYTPYCYNAICDGICILCDYEDKILEKLAEYEDLEEQGKLIRLPCKVGDTIYKVWYKPCHNGETYPDSYSCNGCEEECDMKRVIVEIKAPSIKWIVQNMMDDFGFKIYFLTKEEAEQALAKMKEV